MAKLFVVRHAQVTVDYRIPAAEWGISAEGIDSTRELALHESWDGVSCIYHSPESKAIATAKIISEITRIPMMCMDDLRELKAPIIESTDEFVRRVGEYLGGARDPEFEDWDDATHRIVNCVKKIVDMAAGSSVAMVSHGRILTVLFSYILKRRLTADEWRFIRLPDLSVIDLDAWTVERGFFSGT